MQANKALKTKSMAPTPRGKRAIALMAAGKTGKDAMVAAGYSELTAKNPGKMMARKRMAEYLTKLAPLATEALINGTTVRAMVGKDMGHALQGATLAARLRGLLIERRESLNLNASSPSDLAAMRAELASLYDGAPPSPGHDATLTPQADRSAKSSVDSDLGGAGPQRNGGECG